MQLALDRGILRPIASGGGVLAAPGGTATRATLATAFAAFRGHFVNP